MRTRSAVAIATILLISFIAFAFAANWYYSAYTPEHPVAAWVVTISDPGSYVQYVNVTVTGSVTLGGAPQGGIVVHIWKSVNQGSDVEIPDSPVLTNAAGIYSLQYNVTEASGNLRFRAGINV